MIKIVLAACCLLPASIFGCQVCIDYAYFQLKSAQDSWHRAVLAKDFDYGDYRMYEGETIAYRKMYEMLILIHSGDQD